MLFSEVSTGILSTHVLDTSKGCPASGLRVLLYKMNDVGSLLLGEGITNADGRLDTPLLQGADFKVGRYELIFYTADYFRQHFSFQKEILFLEQIPIRFGISDETRNYHVPLLLSPFGYSTYRGS